MSVFVITLALSVALAALVLAIVAYPSRGRRVPGPEPVSAALDRMGGRVTALLEDVSAR